MNNTILFGCQWGDEGKGKFVDLLTLDAHASVRYQGGHNAGHTIVIDGKSFILTLIPSGVLNEKIQCYIAQGVVVSPLALINELTLLENAGINIRQRLFVSAAATLILPSHIMLDQVSDKKRGPNAIGTTSRGTGPAYEDKIARRGMQIADLTCPERFSKKLEPLLEYHNFLLKHYYQSSVCDFNHVHDELLAQAEIILPLVDNIKLRLSKHYQNNDKVIFEGAQGAMLDNTYGTYPFVTSSNTGAGGVITGAGIGPRDINCVLGITKTYTTRVGNGPLPTECLDDVGKELADRGKEKGTITGRNRRCGWLDMVALRYAISTNSVSHLAITKLDILDTFSTIKVCVSYEYQGELLDHMPEDMQKLVDCKPIYEELPGWQTSTFGITEYKDLPHAAEQYLKRISTLAGIPIRYISTGPDRYHTITVF